MRDAALEWKMEKTFPFTPSDTHTHTRFKGTTLQFRIDVDGRRQNYKQPVIIKENSSSTLGNTQPGSSPVNGDLLPDLTVMGPLGSQPLLGPLKSHSSVPLRRFGF